jgi:hypothetical protein
MAITTNQIYDPLRDMYYEREAYERERERQHRLMKEGAYRQQEQSMYAQQGQAIFGQMNQVQQNQMSQAIPRAAPDPKDPLAFLNKSDSKLLLTGEAL